MSEFQPSCQNSTPGLFNSSCSGWHLYQVISAAETIILPSLIGVICSTGLGGNIVIVFTVIRFIIGQQARLKIASKLKQPIETTAAKEWRQRCLVTSLILMFPVWVYSKVIQFKGGLKSCAFDLTSPDDVLWYMLYLAITIFFFPLPLILICYILILCYTWNVYQQNKKAGSYTTSIPRQRVMRLTKMVLALVIMSVVSTAPCHVIQLMNLQVSQSTLTFYVSYYVSIRFSYTSSNINPFLYILMSGNFQKHLQWCTNVEVTMAEWDVSVIENTLKFLKGGSSPKKNVLYMHRFYRL